MSKEVIKEIKKMFFMILIMSALELLLFFAFGYFNMAGLYGTLLGALVSFLNFLFLGITVEISVKKGKGGAQGAMGLSYTVRLLFIALAVIFAIKSPNINYVAAVIPLIFPRLGIMITKLFNKKKGADA